MEQPHRKHAFDKGMRAQQKGRRLQGNPYLRKGQLEREMRQAWTDGWLWARTLEQKGILVDEPEGKS